MSTSPGSYDPRTAEAEIYRFWEEGGFFHAAPNPQRKPFCIMMPPPNVTGALHLGHALYIIHDLIIRYKRMCGFEALYMPGLDHAGIATQAVVEKRLKEEENKTRHEIGREELVRRIWAWKEEYGNRILTQLRKLGVSADWRRTRFTLDEVCVKSVYELFFRLFKDGLIYRGQRLVNWDAALQTAVADDEIEHFTVKGHLWHLRYPIEGRTATGEQAVVGRDYLIVATTRPETMLGDTAVAVHPEDERYAHLIGKKCILPLMNRPIPVIGDPILVKKEFGSGCVKVTPAHDPNDYECGKRHGLAMINILTTDGKINENGGAYAGLPKEQARKKVVADLEAAGLLEKTEPYETDVGHSDRSKTPIEPMLSEQWFVKMGRPEWKEAPSRPEIAEGLAEMAMQAVRDGRVQFAPSRYAAGYLDWLGEKRDWCISRQLWWGHQIPVWTFPTMPGMMPTSDDALARLKAALADGCVVTAPGTESSQLRALKKAGLAPPNAETLWKAMYCPRPDFLDEFSEIAKALGMQRDPDVLDTWFSSGLWPLNTLGWPHAASSPIPDPRSPIPTQQDFDYFFPTDVLCTGRGIISLWVARMVMTALYNVGRVPFSHVYINPTILDGQGQVMSKSKGNGVDPLDIIELYGTDALRFTMAQLATETQDVRIPVSYCCPHCQQLTPMSAVVPKGKAPADLKQVTCAHCRKPFATQWAPAALKEQLGVARESSERFELGRNFVTKIWQAATGFILPNLTNDAATQRRSDEGHSTLRASVPSSLRPLPLEDRWILTRLNDCIGEVTRKLDRYQFSEAVNRMYDFFWSDFCDWYVELAKPRLKSADGAPRTDDSAQAARAVLAWVLDQSLRLLHPVTPFVTEKVWALLNETAPTRGITRRGPAAKALIIAPWPQVDPDLNDPSAAREIGLLQDVIRGLRDIRTRLNALRSQSRQPALRTLPAAVIRCDVPTAERLRAQMAVLMRLGSCDAIELGDLPKPPDSFSKVLAGVEVYVPVGGLADLQVEAARLRKERDELTAHAARIDAKLSNQDFVAKAPAAVIEADRGRLAEAREKLRVIETNLAEIGG